MGRIVNGKYYNDGQRGHRNINTGGGKYTSTNGGNYYENYRGVIFAHWTKLQDSDVRVSGNIYETCSGECYTDGRVV